jgi:hypothetical protein
MRIFSRWTKKESTTEQVREEMRTERGDDREKTGHEQRRETKDDELHEREMEIERRIRRMESIVPVVRRR